MAETYLMITGGALLVVVVILQIIILLRRAGPDLSPVRQALEDAERSQERTERTVRDEIARNRDETNTTLRGMGDSVYAKLNDMRETVQNRVAGLEEANTAKLDEIRRESAESSKTIREEVKAIVNDFIAGQQRQFAALKEDMNRLAESNEGRLAGMRTLMEEKLRSLQEDNANSLEKMRATVDEKLHGTLEKRLGESFKQVSDRLAEVYKGLGEMQALAAGVGDLKKVLTNVKARGTWGEVQLSRMLEEVFAADQFEANVATRGGDERVEYAVKLPGRGDDRGDFVWLPIDAKFPVEDYQRLMDAQERGDPEAAETASRQLEARIKGCAREISTKYLCPPKTTDFGILFLPTEGLFAEVVRRPGLAESIQRELRVVITGPTTLWAVLNSLQMGFRTLAIEKRSGEVWNLLAAVKTEFEKYGEAIASVRKKLSEASNKIDIVGVRNNAIVRKLKEVQQLPAAEAGEVLRLEAAADEADEAGHDQT